MQGILVKMHYLTGCTGNALDDNRVVFTAAQGAYISQPAPDLHVQLVLVAPEDWSEILKADVGANISLQNISSSLECHQYTSN
jgi:hypothetical protein